MTMKGKWFTTGFVAVLGVLAWAVPSRAGDTIRLNRVDNTPTQMLVDDGRGADTIQTQFRRGFGGFGGVRGFGGWGGRGFGGWGWGGRGLGWGGWGWGGRGLGWGWGGRGWGWGWGGRGLGWGGWGWGRGLGWGWGGWGWGGLGYGLGYGGFYPGFGDGLYGIGYGGYYPGFGYGGFYYPCSGVNGAVYTLAMPVSGGVAPLTTTVQPRYTDYYAPGQAPSGDGTYPYDGGPSNPVPNPKAAPIPQSAPERSVPLEGRAVSLPKPATKWAYPAYGETPRRTSFAEDQTLLTKGQPKSSRSR
jgi:hypothetical protein